MTRVKRKAALSEYRLFETARYQDDLEDVGKNIRDKIDRKIHEYVYPQLRSNPHYGKNIKKIINYDPLTWRYRIGDYRLFYEIDEKARIVYLTALEIRHKAY